MLEDRAEVAGEGEPAGVLDQGGPVDRAVAGEPVAPVVVEDRVVLLRLRVAEVLHRHLRYGLADCFGERPERGPDLGRHGAAGIVVVEDRDPAPVPVVVDDRHEVLPERDGLAGLRVRRLPVLLRDERRGCKDGIVVEQPLLDEQPEGERDRITVLLPEVRGLLADLDDAPEEGVLVGRVGAVPLDDVVDPAVLGEIHC